MSKMLCKWALSVALIIFGSQCCVAATRNKGFGPQTDFKNMSAQEVLGFLNNAERIKIDSKLLQGSLGKVELKSCNGNRPKWSNNRLEMECAKTAGSYVTNHDGILLTMEALFRGCGIYAPTGDESWGDDRSGMTCGLLGGLFFAIGNIDAAKIVWDQAPGCHSRDVNGHRTNGCMRFVVGDDEYIEYKSAPRFNNDYPATRPIETAYRADQDRLLAMAQDACTNELDVPSCKYLNKHGARIDVAAVQNAQDKRSDDSLARFEADREERAAQSREKDERFNAVIGGLQSLPGASDPNAVVNAGNQQAAAIRAVGDANAAQEQAAAQQRLAVQQAAQLAAQHRAAAQQAQQTTNQNASSDTANTSAGNTGGNNSQASTQYAPSLPATCITQFWDPKFYNWLSFENTCGQPIHLSFIATSTNDTFGMSSTDIAPGQASNTGWSQSEVNRKGGFTLFVCPAGYVAVNAATNQSVNQPNQDYRCKKW